MPALNKHILGTICVRDLHECPTDFQWNGQQCVLKAVCPAGYELDVLSDKCIKTEQKCEKITHGNVTCNDINTEDCTKVCINGFKLIDGHCICKVGFILPNGTCIWDGSRDDRCPSGHVWKDGRCQLDFECPQGNENPFDSL